MGLCLIITLIVLPTSAAASMLAFFGMKVALVPEGGELSSLMGYFLSVGGGFWPFAYVLVTGLFLWGCIRVSAKTQNLDTHRLVLGVLSAVLTFFFSSFLNLQIDGRSLALFLLFVSLPQVAYRCAKREEIRLPY